jgi:hypothetical protein
MQLERQDLTHRDRPGDKCWSALHMPMNRFLIEVIIKDTTYSAIFQFRGRAFDVVILLTSPSLIDTALTGRWI